jgi:hypothetical protein
LSRAYFPPILTQNAEHISSHSQAKGMGQPLSQRERSIAPLESLIGVSELP